MSYSNVYHSYLLDGAYAKALADIYAFKDNAQESAALALCRGNRSEALTCIEHLYARFLSYYQTSGIQQARLADDLLEIAEQLTILDPSRACFLQEFYGWYKSLYPQSRELEERRTRRINLIRQGKIDSRILNDAGRYQEIAGIEERLKTFLVGEERPPVTPRITPDLQRPQPVDRSPSAWKGERLLSLARWPAERTTGCEDFSSRKEEPAPPPEEASHESAAPPAHQVQVQKLPVPLRESLFERAGSCVKRALLSLRALFSRKEVKSSVWVCLSGASIFFLARWLLSSGRSRALSFHERYDGSLELRGEQEDD